MEFQPFPMFLGFNLQTSKGHQVIRLFDFLRFQIPRCACCCLECHATFMMLFLYE